MAKPSHQTRPLDLNLPVPLGVAASMAELSNGVLDDSLSLIEALLALPDEAGPHMRTVANHARMQLEFLQCQMNCLYDDAAATTGQAVHHA